MRSISRSRPGTELTLEIAKLATLSVKDLKDRWRSLYGTEPPRYISRELLTRAVGYRLQERAFGGQTHRDPTTRTTRRGSRSEPSYSLCCDAEGYGRYRADSRVARSQAPRRNIRPWRRLSGTALSVVIGSRAIDHWQPLVRTLVLWPEGRAAQGRTPCLRCGAARSIRASPPRRA